MLSLTVMVVVPAETPVTVRRLPLMETVATLVSFETAVYGVVPPLMAQEEPASPAIRDKLVGLTLKAGVTATATVTLPALLSLTVMIAGPAPTPVTERVLPLMETVATLVSLDTTPYGVIPPLIVQVSVVPVERDRLVGVMLRAGATVTSMVTLSEALSLTVTLVVPAETPVTVTVRVLSLMSTVATAVSPELALYGGTPPLMVLVPVESMVRDKLVWLTSRGGHHRYGNGHTVGIGVTDGYSCRARRNTFDQEYAITN